MAKKIRVGIVFGGKSAEHEVSLLSAKNVIEALDRNKYDLILLGIDKNGVWRRHCVDNFLNHDHDPKMISLADKAEEVALIPQDNGNPLVSLENEGPPKAIDVVFPILHGTYGEDGTVQGLLKLANIPFVGAGVLGSAIGMDKDVMKRLLRDAKIPVAKFIVLRKGDASSFKFAEIVEKIGLPFFVKPANLGSSVGISKVKDEKDFDRAICEAFEFDRKILIEEFIEGREIECSVLGNENPIASLPGEIIPTHEFYSYEAKYLDVEGAKFAFPAELSEEKVIEVQSLAVETFKVLCCEGMARVDFFLKKNGELYVNEINTIPGFTNISMYPKLWEISGMSYSKLIDNLIDLAIERFESEKNMKTQY